MKSRSQMTYDKTGAEDNINKFSGKITNDGNYFHISSSL